MHLVDFVIIIEIMDYNFKYHSFKEKRLNDL